MKFGWTEYRKLAAFLGIGMLIALPACNLSAQPRPDSAQIVLVMAAEGGTVASSDGLVRLDIPAGALSEDTEISIAPVSAEDAPEELLALAETYGGILPDTPAYRLQPDGLQFDQPVTIRFEAGPGAIDGDSVEGFALLTQSGNGDPEIIDELEITANLEDGTVVVTGQLSHFSWVVRTKSNLKVILQQVEPKEQAVGAIFNIEIDLENTGTSRIHRHDNIQSTLSASGPVEIIGYNPSGGRIDSPTSTRLRSLSRSLTAGRGTITHLDLKCARPGIASYSLSVKAELVLIPTANQTSPTKVKSIRMTLDAVVRCVAPTSTPTITPSPTDVPTATLTPTDTLTPTVTETPTATPTFTNTPTATPTSTATPVQVGGSVNVGSASCRHGPNAGFLYKYGLTEGEYVMAKGQFNGWLLVMPEFYPSVCWIWNGLVDLEANYTMLPYTNYIGYLPREYEFARQATGLSLSWQGGDLLVSWDAADYIPAPDGRGYMVAANVCRNGLILPLFFQTDNNSIIIEVDSGCSQESTATLYVVHKDGYSEGLDFGLPC